MARKSGDELTDETLFKTNQGPLAFAVGDRILFTKNDRELGVRNGLLGTVEAVGENQISVKFYRNGQDESRRPTIFPKRYSAIDHGYATTIYKSQGATVDWTFILSSQKMDRPLLT